MDITTVIGITLGLGCVLLGQWLEGGNVGSLVQLTAGVIVVGGTMGAVVTQFPLAELRMALRQSRYVFINEPVHLEQLGRTLVEFARRSRREGLLALENEAARVDDPFFKRAILALVDGADPASLRSLLDNLIQQERSFQEPGPRLWEAAGGYAPTVGILGAVLGLIHVMENLADPSRLGAGIAVAFVATVYGVGAANLIFLPLAQKLRTKINEQERRKEMIMDGICSIQEGVNPTMIEKRLSTFIQTVPNPKKR